MEAGSRGESDELGIWFSEEIDRKSGQTIADEKHPDEHPRLAPRVGEPEQEGEHGEQNQPFQSGFVKLAGMAGETIMASGEHNRPGHIGGLSPKLAIHEISETTEKKANRHGAGDIVVDPQPFEAVSSREQDQRERNAGCTTGK